MLSEERGGCIGGPHSRGAEKGSCDYCDATPWGDKVTVHIYVEGDIASAVDVSDYMAQALNAEDVPPMGFAGIGIDPVADRPYDQGCS